MALSHTWKFKAWPNMITLTLTLHQLLRKNKKMTKLPNFFLCNWHCRKTSMSYVSFLHIKPSLIFIKSCWLIVLHSQSWGQSYKPFYCRNLQMFVGMARGLTWSGAPEMCFTLALFANFRLGWKDLPGTNTLAYYKNP